MGPTFADVRIRLSSIDDTSVDDWRKGEDVDIGKQEKGGS